MNWKSFVLGLSVGLVSGFVAKELLETNTNVSPEKALSNAKSLFKQSGPISGSWIHMKPESYEKQGLTYDVYRGGISRTVGHEIVQYEFIADAKTGAIIDSVSLT